MVTNRLQKNRFVPMPLIKNMKIVFNFYLSKKLLFCIDDVIKIYLKNTEVINSYCTRIQKDIYLTCIGIQSD
jgi:hypothetical protein